MPNGAPVLGASDPIAGAEQQVRCVGRRRAASEVGEMRWGRQVRARLRPAQKAGVHSVTSRERRRTWQGQRSAPSPSAGSGGRWGGQSEAPPALTGGHTEGR